MGNLWSKVPPWRTVGSDGNWNLQNQQKLIEDINSIEIPGKGTEFRVLLVGFVHSGKSSFINSVASIDKNRIADAAPSAEGGEGSTTTKLLVYKTKHLIQKVCLIDVMGLEEQTGEGLNHEDVSRILCGEIETGYEFQPKTIDNQNRFYIANADMRWEAHCCVIVIDAEQVLIGSIPERIIDQIELIKKYINAHNNRRVVLLTKTDRLCRDVQNVFESRKVKEAVDKARLKFAVPEMNIFPVINYHRETRLQIEMNILILMALRRMVECSCDQMESNLSIRIKEDDQENSEDN